jgi:putative transposase
MRRQCELLELSRWHIYGVPAMASEEDLLLMSFLDEQYLKTPFYGSRRMTVWLREEKQQKVCRKKVQRLMRLMGIEAIYPRQNTSKRNHEHRVYPYLLRGLSIDKANQVWASDITYIRMARGFLYLVATLDWWSRYIISWQLSNCLDTDFVVEALEKGLSKHQPLIHNSDQGCQFTSTAFTELLANHDVKISMDGKGRCIDNVMVERLWRSLKYEEVYLKSYETVADAKQGIAAYIQFYNTQRRHQALGYKTPQEMFEQGCIQ